MKNIVKFVLDTMPVGVIIYDSKMSIMFSNNRAGKFLVKFGLPREVQSVTERVFAAIRQQQLKEIFPAEIVITRKLEDSPSTWTFYFKISDDDDPFVCIYVIEETASGKYNIDGIRRQYKLTRRENDVLRRVLNGLRNLEIADELGISEQTVKDYLSSIYSKIGVHRKSSLLSHIMNFSDIPPAQ